MKKKTTKLDAANRAKYPAPSKPIKDKDLIPVKWYERHCLNMGCRIKFNTTNRGQFMCNYHTNPGV